MKAPWWVVTGGAALSAVLLVGCNPGDKPSAPTSTTAPAPSTSAAPAAAASQALAPAATSPDSSAACFNEALMTHDGSVVDYDSVVRGDGATPVRRTRLEVRSPATYKGRPATELHLRYVGAAGEAPNESRAYLMLGRDGFTEQAEASGTVLEPLRRNKIDMQPGETFRQEHVIRDGVEGSGKALGTVKWARTYVGRETIESAWGPVQACRFETREERQQPALTQRVEGTQWVAAAGPYRGFRIKSVHRSSYTPPGTRINQTMETLKFHEFTVR